MRAWYNFRATEEERINKYSVQIFFPEIREALESNQQLIYLIPSVFMQSTQEETLQVLRTQQTGEEKSSDPDREKTSPSYVCNLRHRCGENTKQRRLQLTFENASSCQQELFLMPGLGKYYYHYTRLSGHVNSSSQPLL